MSLEEKINADLKTAMKEKNQVALRGIRAVKNALLLAKTDGTGNEVTEEMEIKMVQKLIKQRKESLDIYVKQDREDLAKVEQEEIDVIEKYLPAQLSAEEITPIIEDIIGKTGAAGMKDMGKVMGMASKQLAGQADGKTISNIVKKLLS